MNRRDFNYVDGITISVARKVIKFLFPDNYFEVKKNNEEMTYDVYLIKEDLDIDLLKYFKTYWGNRYRVFIVDWDKQEQSRLDEKGRKEFE